MKIKEIHAEPKYRMCQIVIDLPTDEIRNALALIGSIGSIDTDAEYDISVEKRKKKRSLDANGYLWVLIGELASKLRMSNGEVYRRLIQDYGFYELMAIQTENLSGIKRVWESRGDGWFLIDMGECKTVRNSHTIKCFYGSSVYDTGEMSRLIDGAVTECKENGIETMTPQEIAELKELWR